MSDGNGARDGFSMVQRVRFGDLDAMQHLNNVEFLRFFETARIEFITQLSDGDPGQPGGFGWIFVECHINYCAQAHWNEDIRTWIRPLEVKRSSVKLGFEMRVDGDDRLVAEGWGTLVAYDYSAGRVARLAAPLRERLEGLLSR